jgi:hypothetical protein
LEDKFTGNSSMSTEARAAANVAIFEFECYVLGHDEEIDF